MRPQRIALVTGATGFIARHLARRLLADGWQVKVIVRGTSDLQRLEDLAGLVTIHVYDGTPDSLLAATGEPKPDIVFHLASLFLATHQPAQIAPLVESNILFGTHLLEAMAANSVTRLVNTGTQWQNFCDQEYNPVCLYAATKQAFEAILAFYCETAAIEAVTLRLYDVYGPGDTRPKLFYLLRNALATGVPLAMSPGEQLLDMVYVDDVIEAYRIAGEQLLDGAAESRGVYAISSGAPIQLRELAELYGKLAGKTVPVEWGKRPYRAREVMKPWTSGRPLPGWRPTVNLEQGIARMEGW